MVMYQEIAQNTRRGPDKTVCPAFNARFVFIKYEDGTRCDHLALRINETASDARDKAAAGCLEDEEGVASRLDPARPRWLSPRARFRLLFAPRVLRRLASHRSPELKSAARRRGQ